MRVIKDLGQWFDLRLKLGKPNLTDDEPQNRPR